MQQVLACNQGIDIEEGLRTELAEDGVELAIVGSSHECLQQLRELSPEAVVLGVRSNDPDAVGYCINIRRESNAGVLVVSTEHSEERAVELLNAGADDYFVLRDNYKELAARVRALLRRSTAVLGQRTFSLGDLRINAEKRTVRVRGKEATLTPLEFRLLTSLAANQGKSLSPGVLLRSVQGYDLSEQEATHIIKALVWRLRKKIEADPANPQYIRNVRGSGYILERQRTVAASN